MKAIILAAGRGTRLGNIGKETPKCLIEINGETLLERQIKILKSYKIKKEDIFIVIGKNGDCWSEKNKKKVAEFVKNTFINNHNLETNNAYSLSLALNEHTEDNILILDGDLFLFEHTLDELINSQHSGVISKKASFECPGNKINCDGGGFVKEISRKTNSSIVYGGALKISKKDFELFKDEINKKEYYNLDLGNPINNLSKKIPIKNIINNYWLNVNQVEDIKEINNFIEKNFLVIMGGYTATGKSTIAKRLAESIPKTEIFHSAVIRKELGLTPKTKEEADKFFDYRNKLREEVDRAVYTELAERAKKSLQEGKNVVLDAGYFFKWQRELVYDKIRDLNPEIIVITTKCDNEDEIKRRLLGRGEKFGNDPMNETPSWNAYLSSKEITEPVESDPKESFIGRVEYNSLNNKIIKVKANKNESISKILKALEDGIPTK